MIMLQNYTKVEKQLLFIVSLVWGVDLLYYLKAVVMRLPVLQYVADAFVPTIVTISIVVCMRSIKTKIYNRDLLLYIGALLLYLSHYILYPQNEEFLSNSFFELFIKIVPFFFIGLLFDEQKHLPILTYISIAYVILGTIYFYFFASQSVEYNLQEEKMGMAYAYLPHVLLIIYSLFNKFKIYKLLPLIMGLLMMLGTGNRGSLLLVLVFVVLYLLLCGKKKRSSLLWILLLCVVGVVYFYWEKIIDVLFSILEQFGMNTRVLRLVVEGNLSDDNGRNELLNLFIQKIGESPIFGYGIMGDRVLLLYDENSYPHNIVIEFLIQYGVVLGVFFLFMIAIYTIKAWKMIYDNNMKVYFIILFVTGILALFISDSYLMNPFFYMYLGLCVNCVRRNVLVQKM